MTPSETSYIRPSDCPACGLPNPEAKDPVNHQIANCAYCRHRAAKGNYGPPTAEDLKRKRWRPEDGVR